MGMALPRLAEEMVEKLWILEKAVDPEQSAECWGIVLSFLV